MKPTKKFLKKILYTSTVFLTVFLVQKVYAQGTPYTIPNPVEIDTVEGLLQKVINYILGISGTLALLAIVIGGFRYLMAGGNEKNAEEGKKILKWAIIGLVIILLAAALVNTVIKALSGGGAAPVPVDCNDPANVNHADCAGA